MSFRNGDKSREHRIRKARQKMREKTRKLAGAGRRPEAIGGRGQK